VVFSFLVDRAIRGKIVTETMVWPQMFINKSEADCEGERAVVGLVLADLRGLKRRFARMVWCSEIDAGMRGGWVGSRRFARIETQICADGDNRVVF
jgi:hypothetical protein